MMKGDARDLASRSDIHLSRKIWHVCCGLISFSLYYLSNLELKTWGWIALVIALVAFVIDISRLKNERFNQMAINVFGPFMRKSEYNSFSGFPFYALGMALSILLFNSDIALLSIMFLVFADPLASFIGVKYGTTKLLPNKSLEGSLSAFTVCFVISMIYIGDYDITNTTLFIASALFALVGMLSELISTFNIDDNLTIPVLSGLGISFVNLIFNIF